MQSYQQFRIIYIDDCSKDKTTDLVNDYIQDNDLQSKISLIRNRKRRYKMANMYDAIHSCKNNEIIIELDGDDWLAHNNVLELLNKVYENPNIWLTYGQYKEFPSNKLGGCAQVPEDVIKKNQFRHYYWVTSALRTYYAGIFKLIDAKDFMYKGKFVQKACDLAYMFPMLEMAGEHIKFIPEIIYIYNRASPINDDKENWQIIVETEEYIRSKKRYKPLKTENFLKKIMKSKYLN
jgi:glycosyltransferase involved in cell wall biosynthesis